VDRGDRPRVVAIDGPAGAGKSTVARRLAAELGFVLLDTGALYRAVALAAERAGIAWDDEPRVAALTRRIAEAGELTLEPDPSAPAEQKGLRVLLAGEDVSRSIRTPSISMGASRVSAIVGVRSALLDLQRAVARSAAGVVAEGRDIGTVVFPDAPVKFFLTASLEVRARRRQEELLAAGVEVAFDATCREVEARDRQDSEREVAPLCRASDAALVDSSDKSVDELVADMKRRVHDALG
jgi:cytidylate kinase